MIKIKRENVVAEISPKHGGRLSSLKIDGQEILVTEGTDPFSWGCYPMVPWAGRVREGQFEWHGNGVDLPINLEPHAIHGTTFSRPWTQLDDTRLTIPLGPDWPWAGSVTSAFTLTPNELEWTIQIEATNEPMPAIIGWHPWFLRNSGTNETCQYQFEAEQMYQRDASGIPTGNLVETPPGPWDDCFTGVKKTPLLQWSNGLNLTLTSTCKYWVVYDQPTHAFCIEPQSGPPDGFNLGLYEIVSPGQPLEHSMTFQWWRDE